jgi:putative transposase
MKTFKYRLLPTKNQRTKLLQTLELCRWVYNKTLAIRKNAWDTEGKTFSLYETNKFLKFWKREHPELAQVHSQVFQQAQQRVDLAFRAFFRRVKEGKKPGYPRFRNFGRYDSFTFTQFGFKLLSNGLLLSKIGSIKIILHRPIEGRIKTLTIRRDKVGNWYACFSCEVECKPLPFNDLAIGIDMGIERFATTSNGKGIANPRFLRRDEKELTKAQRKLSMAEKGTRAWEKRRRAVAHIHQRITNRRKDFAHKHSRELVNHFGMIVFEKLTIRNMLRNHHLAKSISDAAWSQLIQYTSYKAENAGRMVVLVDPCKTSKQCSRCGTLVDKSLTVRFHNCPACGLVIDRDQNAALNILGLGLQSLGYALEAPAYKRGD